MAKPTFFNKFPEIAAAFGQIAEDIVTRTATELEYQIAQAAPVDTGALQASVYKRTYAGNDMNEAISSKKGKARRQFFPMVKQPANQYEAFVAVGAKYGIYVELGTFKMPAQPFFYPAVDAVQADFDQIAGDLEAQIRQFVGGE